MSPTKDGSALLRPMVAGASVGAAAAALAAFPLVIGPQHYLAHGLHLLAAQAIAGAALRGCGFGAVAGLLAAGAVRLARGRVSARAEILAAWIAAVLGFAGAAAWEISALLLWPRYRAANSLAAVGVDAGLALLLCGLLGAALLWASRRRAWGRWVCAAPALLALSGAAALHVASPVARGPNLLLVTIDTLRADRVGSYGYAAARTPTLDALAREGVLFETVVASAPVTLTATATLLTGLDPQHHGAAHNGFYRLRPGVVTLAELLANDGYRTAAVIGNFALDHRFAVDQGFAHFDDAMTQRMDADAGAVARGRESWWSRYRRTQPAQRFADEVTDAALAWLAQAGSRPFFLWVHYMDPHTPYRPPAAFAEGADAYDGEVAFVDAELGRLRRGLAELLPGADTLTVVTADHGESLGEHGVRGHAWVLYEQTVRVPLIMQRPGVVHAGERVARPLRGRDVAGRVLIALGREDLAARLGPGAHSEQASDAWWAYAQSYQARFARGETALRMLRDARWKLIRPDGGSGQLFDLRSDPLELRDAAAAHPERVERMAAQLDALVRGVEDEPEPVDPDTEERLRALGYLP